MKNHPKISVIMSVYNEEKYLKRAIESILNQTFNDFEFIIVNDSSTDNSLEIIQSYHDGRIKVINNGRRTGLAACLNKALAIAKGEYIGRQDADDFSLPNRFEEQIEYFKGNPKTALLGTDIYLMDEKGKIFTQKKAMPHLPSDKLSAYNPFVHGSVMFKKAVVDDLGAYNSVFKYAQDYELWSRIAKRYEVRNLGVPLYVRRYCNTTIHGIKHWLLFGMLANKLAKGEINKNILGSVKRNGVRSIYLSLTAREKFYFFKSYILAIFLVLFRFPGLLLLQRVSKLMSQRERK